MTEYTYISIQINMWFTVSYFPICLFSYSVMLQCWNKESCNRPSFAEITHDLQELWESQRVSLCTQKSMASKNHCVYVRSLCGAGAVCVCVGGGWSSVCVCVCVRVRVKVCVCVCVCV